MRKFSLERIQEARQRLDKSSRGSDKEYYKHLFVSQFEMLSWQYARFLQQQSCDDESYNQLLEAQMKFVELWNRLKRQYEEFIELYTKFEEAYYGNETQKGFVQLWNEFDEKHKKFEEHYIKFTKAFEDYDEVIKERLYGAWKTL